MIVKKDKTEKEVQQPDEEKVYYTQPLQVADDDRTLEKVSLNPISEAYYALRRILLSLKKNPDDPDSPPLFNMVKLDTGQFDRIVLDKYNSQDAIAFPAAFIRFVEMRYLASQQNIYEGRAVARIRFILNNIANEDYQYECDGFAVFQQINQAIQDAKSSEPALTNRCNLSYFDMPETMSDGLQAFWIDYDVWFNDMSAWVYRNWVERRLVFPPFTNHSDAPEYDTEHHGDHTDVSYDDATKFVNYAENEEEDEE